MNNLLFKNQRTRRQTLLMIVILFIKEPVISTDRTGLSKHKDKSMRNINVCSFIYFTAL